MPIRWCTREADDTDCTEEEVGACDAVEAACCDLRMDNRGAAAWDGDAAADDGDDAGDVRIVEVDDTAYYCEVEAVDAGAVSACHTPRGVLRDS